MTLIVILQTFTYGGNRRHSLHFPNSCSVWLALPCPFILFLFCLVAQFIFILSYLFLCIPLLMLVFLLVVSFLLFSPSLILLHCMDVHMHACVSLPYPPFFSWVISLSYVCPNLCVCVLPSFVSDSFSREIRDAYLVPLFPRSATAQFHCAATVSS